MLNEKQLSRIKRIKDFYMEEPVFKHHVSYVRVMRQRLNFMRAYINSIGTEWIGPAVTPYNTELLKSRPYTARLRLAYAEAAILNNMEPMIHDDELLVGRPDYTPLTEEEEDEYKNLELAMRGAPNTTYLTLGHMSLDYPKLLRVGINGLIAEVKARKDALDLNDPENLPKCEFYEGCLMELEAELVLQRRYAEKLKEKAEKATGEKKEHFEKLYEIVSRVPAEPARTFREALQAIHFFSFTLWELYYFGRIDQYLYPYYKADLEAGRITPDEALELLDAVLAAYVQQNDYAGISFIHWAKGGIFRLQGHFEEGIAQFQKAISFAKKAGDKISEAYGYCGLAGISRICGKIDDCVKNYKRAEVIFVFFCLFLFKSS